MLKLLLLNQYKKESRSDILSDLASAYRSKYSSNHIIMGLIEERKEKLNKGTFTRAVLMDLSKAFDCIPHNLLISRLNVYHFDRKSLVFFYSYLQRRKQCVNVNDIQSTFQTLLSGVPQGLIFGPLPFNIFINDLIRFIKKFLLYSLAMVIRNGKPFLMTMVLQMILQ